MSYVTQIELNDLLARLKDDAVRSLKLTGTENMKKEAEQRLRNKMDGKGDR